MDIYHEDIIWNSKMKGIVEQLGLKVRSYSFYQSLYHKNNWIIPRPHKPFNKESQIHSLRDPSPRRGILVLIDGTPHDWFQNGKKQSLHLAVDDATNEILCGWFMATECQLGYCHLLKLLITKHGIPENLYSDKHTILKSPKDGNLTQVGRMCDDLGINMIFAGSAEARGKIEKANDTVQQRLLNDIKRFNITSVEQLNIWFNKFYASYLNKKFAYKSKEEKSEFIPLEKDFDLTAIFCLKDTRRILSGNSISYNNKYYIPIDENNNSVPMYRGSKVEVWEDVFNHNIRIFKNNIIYNTKSIPRKVRDNTKINHKMANNQKEMQEILDLCDERRKARANLVSSS